MTQRSPSVPSLTAAALRHCPPSHHHDSRLRCDLHRALRHRNAFGLLPVWTRTRTIAPAGGCVGDCGNVAEAPTLPVSRIDRLVEELSVPVNRKDGHSRARR